MTHDQLVVADSTLTLLSPREVFAVGVPEGAGGIEVHLVNAGDEPGSRLGRIDATRTPNFSQSVSVERRPPRPV